MGSWVSEFIKIWREYLAAYCRQIYLPPLAKAEAEERFRKLVAVDKIGVDTPVYKKYNKHRSGLSANDHNHHVRRMLNKSLIQGKGIDSS